MTEIEILGHAKSYIDKLAKGINPITDQAVNENDVVNNVRVSRCLFYVSGVLDKVIQKEMITPMAKSNQIPFSLPSDIINQFQYSELPVPVSIITRQINSFVSDSNMKKLKPNSITAFLLQTGFLQRDVAGCLPTQKGIEAGLSVEERKPDGKLPYKIVLYNKDAQKMVTDNMSTIADINNQQIESLRIQQNSGMKWTQDEELKLQQMYDEGVNIKDIATQFKRTEGAIRSRLQKIAEKGFEA